MPKNKVLVIDDSELFVKSTCMALNYCDFEAKGVLDGKDGLILAESFRPDIILLDIVMPGMEGGEVLKRLKQIENTKNIPVIIVTAYEDERSAAISYGALECVLKPFDIEELVSTINKYLNSKSNGDSKTGKDKQNRIDLK